jgi:hypothetical protein
MRPLVSGPGPAITLGQAVDRLPRLRSADPRV